MILRRRKDQMPGQWATMLNGSSYWMKSGAAGFDFGSGTNFTILLTLKTSSVATLQRIISKKTNASGGGDPGFQLELRSSKIQFNFGDSVATVGTVGNAILRSGTPYFVAITVQRTGSAIVYIDGSVDTSAVISSIGSVNNALALGIGSNTNGSNPVIGTLGRIQVISGKVFTAAEIKSLHQRRTRWPKNHLGGTTVLDIDWKNNGRDSSASSNNLTATGSPLIIKQ